MEYSLEQMLPAASENVEAIWRRIKRSTPPFLKSKNGRLEHVGTGVLLRVADSAFVLTAFHVLKPVLEDKIPMSIGAGPENSPGIELSGLRILKADDPFDFALVELTPELSDRVTSHNSYINLSQCDVSDSFDPRQLFFVCGFPSADTFPSTLRKTLHLAPFGFFTGRYLGDSSQIPEDAYQDRLHLLFDYSEGTRMPLPEPVGISGAGAWKLPSHDVAVESWEFNRVRLVAIVHSIHVKKQVLIATRLKYVLRLLYQRRPDLRDSIRISFPSLE